MWGGPCGGELVAKDAQIRADLGLFGESHDGRAFVHHLADAQETAGFLGERVGDLLCDKVGKIWLLAIFWISVFERAEVCKSPVHPQPDLFFLVDPRYPPAVLGKSVRSDKQMSPQRWWAEKRDAVAVGLGWKGRLRGKKIDDGGPDIGMTRALDRALDRAGSAKQKRNLGACVDEVGRAMSEQSVIPEFFAMIARKDEQGFSACALDPCGDLCDEIIEKQQAVFVAVEDFFFEGQELVINEKVVVVFGHHGKMARKFRRIQVVVVRCVEKKEQEKGFFGRSL